MSANTINLSDAAIKTMKVAELRKLVGELHTAMLEQQAELEILRKSQPAPKQSVTGRIVGNIVAGSPVYPQVKRFADEHNVSTTKVVITGMRMEIR